MVDHLRHVQCVCAPRISTPAHIAELELVQVQSRNLQCANSDFEVAAKHVLWTSCSYSYRFEIKVKF